MSSWLSFSLPNPFQEEEEKEEEEEEGEEKSSTQVEENDEEMTSHSVKEDLSELTKSITRQLWGVAAFLAPPPSSCSPSSSSQTLLGIRNDFAEIGGSFKTGFSLLSTNKAVDEISKLASTLLLSQPKDEGAGVVGVSEEVLEFARDISSRPEAWLNFPLPPSDDDFDMSDAQREHASTVEHLIPSLAALRIKLCPSHISEQYFWMIYFLLLQPILNEHDSELLLTPKIVEARSTMRQQLQNRSNSQVQISEAECLSPEVSGEDIIIEEENNDIQEKEVLVETVIATHGLQLNADEHKHAERWLEKGSELSTSVDATDDKNQQENEDDVSFSDLEVDDDDDVLSKHISSRSKQESAQVSSSTGHNEWVRLNQNADVHNGKNKETYSSQKNNSDADESSDWLTVDDFDFDS